MWYFNHLVLFLTYFILGCFCLFVHHVVFMLAARYQNELAGVEAEQLAERFYHQALSVMPHVGE